jgi:subtilisin family serine protease
MDHPDLSSARIREELGQKSSFCTLASSVACMHGTFIAGMLCARRGSSAPAICPDSTLLVRPIFQESSSANGHMPSATSEELAAALTDAIGAGANVINLSAAITQPSSRGERKLQQALDYAAHREVLVVAAAGNHGMLGSSAITRHRWVIPVIGCDLKGQPTTESNLGSSIGKWGLAAPGQGITSLGTDGQPQTLGGTSVAAPFVTGTIALLWSEFPGKSAAAIKLAVTQSGSRPRRTIVPPLLDSWAAYEALNTIGLES